MLDDPAIRTALKKQLVNADSTISMFDEFPIWRGEGRADVVAANGALWGFEIKGEGDTLARLQSQTRLYDSIFQYSVAVIAKKHLSRLREILPSHWGIEIAEECSGGISFRKIRSAKRNNRTDPAALARLFWRNEAIKLLREQGKAFKPSTLIMELWQELAQLPRDRIAHAILCVLKSRGGSESVTPQIQDDGSCTIEPIALRFPGR